MADCLNCKHNIRYEYYDGQWGMFKYDKRCSAGVSVIIDGKLNPWSMECDLFELGNPRLEPMTEKEKQQYDPDFFTHEDFQEKETPFQAENAVKAFAKLGIQIKNSEGAFRDMGDILDELSNTWNSLSLRGKNKFYRIFLDITKEKWYNKRRRKIKRRHNELYVITRSHR